MNCKNYGHSFKMKCERISDGKQQAEEMKLAVVFLDGKATRVKTGTLISDITGWHKPCGGHGRCGKCKVIAKGEITEVTEAERVHLTEEELALGVRLSCFCRVLGDCEVRSLNSEGKARILTDGDLPEFEFNPIFSQYGVAIDIGTTTLAARLYDAKGVLLAEASRLNPQSAWGADVISRVEAALGGKDKQLAFSARRAIDGMITELVRNAMIKAWQIDAAVITGNTVMLSILTHTSVVEFSHAPFEAKRLFGETLTAKELGLECLKCDTRVYIPPCIHAFVGADTTCALLSVGINKSDGTVMLADIGTNGEMAICNKGKLTVCSTAAGPAFEGVDISMGMRGAVGAIDKVFVSEGRLKAHTIGDVTPIGICGSGLIDAVACMLELDVLDASGYLEGESFNIVPTVYINQKDIRMLQLAKSAICAGLLSLIGRESISVDGVERLYVAGGFGTYLNKNSAAAIGLLPKALADVSLAVGNAALTGAAMLLLNGDFKELCHELSGKAEVLNLASDKSFSNYYISGMSLGEI